MAEDSYFTRLTAKVVKQFGVGLENINWYTSKEIEVLFDGKKLTQKVLNSRKKAFIIYSYKKRFIVLGGRMQRK